MPAKKKVARTSEEIRLALDVLKDAGVGEGSWVWDTVTDLLPPSERPPIDETVSMTFVLTTPSGLDYSDTFAARLSREIKTRWEDFEFTYNKHLVKFAIRDRDDKIIVEW